MAMNVGGENRSGEPEVMMEINMTPLIDVMLVLLIMLIITIPIQHQAVNLNMPVSGSPPVIRPEVITLDVDANGTVLWDGQTVPDRAALANKFQSVAAMPEQAEVHVRPNKLAEYKAVAAVLASAQRSGVSKIGIVDD